MSRKICFVSQRYGLEVNGGAELQCRQMAEQLNAYYESIPGNDVKIEILTSKAVDYISWKNEYKSDCEQINGITVRRFDVEKERSMQEFADINLKLSGGALDKMADEYRWLELQGPYTPKLIEYIRSHSSDYDVFIFMTYLYYPTVMGLPEVADKSILIPEAHDEPYLRMNMYRDVFMKAKAIFYNTQEERRLINIRFRNGNIKSELGGVGIEVTENADADRFKKKYNLNNYIVYVGRIDQAKGCAKLFEDFIEYKKANNNDLKLVLMGKPAIDIPESGDIIALGFVSEEDKFSGIKGAKALVLPSEFESLSIVVLEAMSLKVPVIVNGACDVVRGHCIKSNAGLYYYNYNEFEGSINYILSHSREAGIMGLNGEKYVKENYQWNIITEKLVKLIDYVKS